MIELKKDKKSPTWVVTTTDSEGFHRQLNIQESDLDELVRLWEKYNANVCTTALLTKNSEMTEIKIVNKGNQPLPAYATPQSAGMDLRANIREPVVLNN